MAKTEQLVVSEQSQSMFSKRKKIPTKRPPHGDDKADKCYTASTPRTKPASFSSTSTSSENHDYSKPFVPPTALNSEQEDEPPVITCSEEEAGVTIAPSTHQRQLMRQVSGLGLEDPVFGGMDCQDNSMTKEHASFFLDDMDFHDVPEDMRDMISCASDRTDVVEIEGQSMEDSKSPDKRASAYSHSSSSRRGSMSSLPPLGLDPGMAAAVAPAPLSSIKSKAGKIPRSLTLNDSNHQSIVSGLSYVPASGSYKPKTRQTKREHRCSTASSIVLEDKNLAAQVNAMLSMNESTSSFSSPTKVRTTHNKKQANLVIKRQDSRLSTCSSKYTAPPLPLSAGMVIQEGERFLPESMDDIFGSKPPSKSRTKKSSSSVQNTKKKSESKPLKTKKSRDNSEKGEF